MTNRAYRLKILLLFFFIFPLFSNSKENSILEKIKKVISTKQYERSEWLSDPNKPSPELGILVEEIKSYLENNKEFKSKSNKNRAFQALLIQTQTHLQHVSFVFDKEDADYVHKTLFQGQYPIVPTLKALEKAVEFFEFIDGNNKEVLLRINPDPEMERSLMTDHNNIVKSIINNPFSNYIEMRNQIRESGPNANFKNRFESMVDYLLLKLKSDNAMIDYITDQSILRNFRDKAIEQLVNVKERNCPYLDTIEAIERTLEFYDVYFRAIDPNRSPILYHSGRYEYYLHFLKASTADHILFPTLANLGATDLLKMRGVAFGFAGVNTDINYVDGYYQTPFEFYIHDINHVRRMFLFFEKAAKKYGYTIEEFAEISNKFVRDALIPMISIHPNDSREVKNIKRLKKILFFEMLHEDALAAFPNIIEEAILRKAGERTPFERIDNGKKVVYLMEPGASTLAYVFRKLTHDFYDMPGDRFNNIVEPEFRTYEHITKATMELMKDLGFMANQLELETLLKQDTGFPRDFEDAVLRDRLRRINETTPLISSERAFNLAKDALEKNNINASLIDDSKPMEIINFFRDTNRINVHLRIPVRDERKKIEVLVNVPEELYSGIATKSRPEQIKGQSRIVEIKSGPYLNLSSLKDEFLSRLNHEQYTVVVRSDDSKAAEIIQTARSVGLKTILLMDISKPRISTQVSPTYFLNVGSKRAVNKIWNNLGPDKTNQDIRLDFSRPLKKGYAEHFSDLENNRLQNQRRIEDELVRKGIGKLDLNDFSKRFGDTAVPISFSGPILDNWANLAEAQKKLIIDTIERTVFALDPSKVVIVTGGMSLGIEKVIHEVAKSRGIKTLGLLSESSEPDLIGSISHAAITHRSHGGKVVPIMNLLQEHKGFAIYISGGEFVEQEIEYNRKVNVDYFLMKGPKGAANNYAMENSNRAFQNNEELLGLIFKKHATVISTRYQTAARDSFFLKETRTLKAQGIDILSYQDLVNKSRGKNVVLINGYVGLGYENKNKLRQSIKDLMKREGDNTVFVGVGSNEGIGQMYDWIPELAKELNFKNIKTASIVSRNAADKVKASINWIHFVETDVNNWRPVNNGNDVQVQFLKDTAGKMICYRGGEITGLVAEEALNSGLPVEIVIGDSFDPNKEKVNEALKIRFDSVIDGTLNLVKNKKQYPTLKVVREIKALNQCLIFYGNRAFSKAK